MRPKKHNPRNERPISLKPLSLPHALKKAMEAKPLPKQKTPKDKK